MRLFHFKGDKSKFVTKTEFAAVKLAKEKKNKKTEVTYTDVFINKIKELTGASGSDKQVIDNFILKLTNDK